MPRLERWPGSHSLGEIGSDSALEVLRNLLIDPIQQVRLSTLATLAKLAKTGPKPLREKAREILASAIRWDLSEASVPKSENEIEPQSLAGASKVEDAASGQIRITPDGEIVTADQVQEPVPDDGDPNSNVIESHFPKSTLEAIQAPVTDLSEETDTPLSQDELAYLSESNKGHRRRRVAVDGPNDTSMDIRLIALRVAADCPGRAIDRALASVIGNANATLRAAAFAAIAQRSETSPLSTDFIDPLLQALGDPDPFIRGYASQAVARQHPDAATHLSALLGDADAIVRSQALKAVAASTPGRAIAGFRDPSALVRKSALDSVLANGTVEDLEDGLRLCLEEGFTDCLVEARKRSDAAQDVLISVLGEENTPARQTRAALEALSSVAPSAR